MSFMSRLLKQCRKPSGWFGEMVGRGMNSSHAPLTGWGLTHISVDKQDVVLDIGCGGGRTISRLAEMAAEGKVYGIDYSEKSVSLSSRKNRRLIAQGRVEIRQGEVSRLPYPDGMFDLVTAVETHYFWPDLVSDFREVRRVLKPGGTLLVIGAAYKDGIHEERNLVWIKLGDMAYHNVEEFRALFEEAGYTNITVDTEPEEGWICALCRKPV